jgi:hypothetical protein
VAKLLVLTDRNPNDYEWKGAFAWDLIRSLAESQHQVLVLTTEDLDEINVTHPRLTVARPAKSWGLQYLPKFLQAILLYQPEVICTLSPRSGIQLKGLTIWPYLDAALNVLPKIKRYSALFESDDTIQNPSVLAWHKGAKSCVVFTSGHRQDLRQEIEGEILVSPFEIQLPLQDIEPSEHPYLLVPAPVSEWSERGKHLQALRDHLIHNPGLHARINGGWGDLPAAEKRSAWQSLMPVADRLHLLEPLTWPQVVAQAQGAAGFWLDGIPADSWRDVISRFAASQLGKSLPENRPALPAGSTVNFLSRLFAGTFEPWLTP